MDRRTENLPNLQDLIAYRGRYNLTTTEMYIVGQGYRWSYADMATGYLDRNVLNEPMTGVAEPI